MQRNWDEELVEDGTWLVNEFFHPVASSEFFILEFLFKLKHVSGRSRVALLLRRGSKRGC